VVDLSYFLPPSPQHEKRKKKKDKKTEKRTSQKEKKRFASIGTVAEKSIILNRKFEIGKLDAPVYQIVPTELDRNIFYSISTTGLVTRWSMNDSTPPTESIQNLITKEIKTNTIPFGAALTPPGGYLAMTTNPTGSIELLQFCKSGECLHLKSWFLKMFSFPSVPVYKNESSNIQLSLNPTAITFHPCDSNYILFGLESGHIVYFKPSQSIPNFVAVHNAPITSFQTKKISENSCKMYAATSDSRILICVDTLEHLEPDVPKSPPPIHFDLLKTVSVVIENPQNTYLHMPKDSLNILVEQASSLQIWSTMFEKVVFSWKTSNNTIINDACCTSDGKYIICLCQSSIFVFTATLLHLQTFMMDKPASCIAIPMPWKNIVVGGEDGILTAYDVNKFVHANFVTDIM